MSSDFLIEFQSILNRGLPGEDAHLEVSPVGRIRSSEVIKGSSDYKESAVGIYIFEVLKNPKGILIQRPDYPGTHGGQISFPGGKREIYDRDLEHTARRESNEEVGIPEHIGLHLGKLTPVYIPVSNFLVEPHLFFLEKPPILKADPVEVKEIVLFDLFDLKDPNCLSKMKVELNNGFHTTVPCFQLANKQVWGATALMLNELKYILKKF